MYDDDIFVIIVFEAMPISCNYYAVNVGQQIFAMDYLK